jgi:hypothetical protein
MLAVSVGFGGGGASSGMLLWLRPRHPACNQNRSFGVLGA